MSTETICVENTHQGKAMKVCQVQSFAVILRNVLGEAAWKQLEMDIAQRFRPYVSEQRSLQFHGKMQWVYCSPLGYAVSKVIKRFSILPDVCTRDSEFSFDIGLRGATMFKQRMYELETGSCFRFTSQFTQLPRLHEEFNGGIGMYLRLMVRRGALLFRDEGYFLRIKNWRLRLPRWLTVGHFDLLHRNIDAQRFQIMIRVAHPLLGTLFYQRGEFTSKD